MTTREAKPDQLKGPVNIDSNKSKKKTPFDFRLINWFMRSLITFGKETVLKIDYNEGYNFNFEITEEEAASLLPSNLRPLKLKLCEEDEEPAYYLSWYLASMDTVKTDKEAQRVDLFTYCLNEEDELSLFFVSCIMEMPGYFQKRAQAKKMYLRIFEYFARDTRTGDASYPHFFSQRTKATGNSFVVEYQDSLLKCDEVKFSGLVGQWDRVFICANSQIYRNEVDKNTNFFNQRFVAADVHFLDMENFECVNLEGFHPLCKNLKSVHFYGSKEKPSKWYIEL